MISKFALKSDALQRGFTLVELLVVTSISAILLAAGVPMFNSTIASSKSYDAVNTLSSAFELARSEAMRRGVNVTVCRVLDANAASPACSTAASAAYPGNDWAAGWVVFAETAPASAIGSFEAGDTVVARQMMVGGGSSMRTAIVASTGFITFGTKGLRTGAAGAQASFDTSYYDSYAQSAASPRCLKLSVLGQPSGSKGTCS